jgi:hypothetical protein
LKKKHSGSRTYLALKIIEAEHGLSGGCRAPSRAGAVRSSRSQFEQARELETSTTMTTPTWVYGSFELLFVLAFSGAWWVMERKGRQLDRQSEARTAQEPRGDQGSEGAAASGSDVSVVADGMPCAVERYELLSQLHGLVAGYAWQMTGVKQLHAGGGLPCHAHQTTIVGTS